MCYNVIQIEGPLWRSYHNSTDKIYTGDDQRVAQGSENFGTGLQRQWDQNRKMSSHLQPWDKVPLWCLWLASGYSLLDHTSWSRSNLRTFWWFPPHEGFMFTGEDRDPLSRIEAIGEFSSSSSSSLVYDFLSTDEPLLLRWPGLLVSPIISTIEAGEGGTYTGGVAIYGYVVTESVSTSIGSCNNMKNVTTTTWHHKHQIVLFSTFNKHFLFKSRV